MSVLNQQQRVAIAGIEALVGSLPETDKGEVLKAVFSNNAAQLTSEQRAVLLETLPRVEHKATSNKAQVSALTQKETRALISKAGGIFIGKEELVTLGKLAADAVLPEIPAKFSQAFLESKHPLRERTIASHIILGFDPITNKWHTVDRGEGGRSDIVPGSLEKDGRGLRGDEQEELLKKYGAQIKVEDARISTHKNSLPIERILDNAVALHLAAAKPIETAPFYGIWGRTGDTQNTASGYPRFVGRSGRRGSVLACDPYYSDPGSCPVGLIAGWN